MDPDRVRAYLQVACAGLGFDIGEVWWTSNENGSSTVAAIGRFQTRHRSVSSHGRIGSSRVFGAILVLLVSDDDFFAFYWINISLWNLPDITVT